MEPDYLTSANQILGLDRWVDKNPVYPVGGATMLLGSTLQYVQYWAGGAATPHDDFLARFLRAQRDYSAVIDDCQVTSYLSLNILTGADTTAIAIKAVMYYGWDEPFRSGP